MKKEVYKLTHKELQEEYIALLERNERIQKSLSWVITKPLRMFGIDYLVVYTCERISTVFRRLKTAAHRRIVFWTGPAARSSSEFVLYRIIGNDLYPRHAKGQQRNNLEFILENEPQLADCQKVFVVNRIIDEKEEASIIKLLEDKGCEYIHIPFVKEEYLKIGFDTSWVPDGLLSSSEFISRIEQQQSDLYTGVYRQKNKYIMNNNGARNVALRDGKRRNARWILPWDGNCYVSSAAWSEIQREVRRGKYLKFFIVPMSREQDNSRLLREDYRPTPDSEPQIIFRNDTKTEFNENYTYGRRPKVELFWTLGVKGKDWDHVVTDSIWDYPRRELSDEAGEYGYAGWTSRLSNGPTQLSQETEDKEAKLRRSLARNEAIQATINYVDRKLNGILWDDPVFYSQDKLETEFDSSARSKHPHLSSILQELVKSADSALKNKPYSVTEKTTLPPSGNPHDYWHVAPYAWPNPDTLDGLPYVARDGQRVSGTSLGEKGSEQYDRTRVQGLFNDTITLALAWMYTKDRKYATHAARLVETFFVNDKTKMSPNMTYAQVWMGKNNNLGSGSGIIEFKDIYFFLDAVRLVIESGAMDQSLIDSFKDWLSDFLIWLQQSDQGSSQVIRDNNLGTFYDLTVACIADFLEDDIIVKQALFRAQNRIGIQFSPKGEQVFEVGRTQSQHYCYFNMQGWLLLSVIAGRHGVTMWDHVAKNGATLPAGVRWLLDNSDKWQSEQIKPFDTDRVDQLHISAAALGYKPAPVRSKYEVKPVFFSHDSIRPYWNLGL